MDATPEKLTRFYGTPEYALEVFQERTICFISSSKMNDPFDPYFAFLTGFDSYAGLRKWIRENRGAKAERRFIEAMPYDHWARALMNIRARSDERKRHTFLFCTSAPWDEVRPENNLYMWAHYGCGHRGVAIEYDSAKLRESALKHQFEIAPAKEMPRDLWVNIYYGDQIEKVSAEDFYRFVIATSEAEGDAHLSKSLDKIVRQKGAVWKPEQEWRLMWDNDDPGREVYKVPILEGSVSRLLIGLRTPIEQAARIARACRSAFPDAKILRAKARIGEFALDFGAFE